MCKSVFVTTVTALTLLIISITLGEQHTIKVLISLGENTVNGRRTEEIPKKENIKNVGM
jgi:hypothetical protein